MTLQAQVTFNEISPNPSQSESVNDAFIELMGPPGADISCWVMSNSEWAIVFPSGTTIPADGLFLVACSNDPTVDFAYGITECGETGSGLACDFCDFPGLAPQIDFDVCATASANYFEPTNGGFVLLNNLDSPGDQVVLFDQTGAIQDAVYWIDDAPNTVSHNNTVREGNDYTLGRAGTPNSDYVSVVPGVGDCDFASNGVEFVMPALSTGGIYTLINTDVDDGCNSSFLLEGGTWSTTEHPNPGVDNSSIAFDLDVPNQNFYCEPTRLQFTLEVYNYQHVQERLVNDCGGQVGSWVYNPLIDDYEEWGVQSVGATNNGITVFEYQVNANDFFESGTYTFVLQWSDFATQNGSAELPGFAGNPCYERIEYTVTIVTDLEVSQTAVSCPDDFEPGVVNVSQFVTGGFNNIYRLYEGTTEIGANGSGVFSLPLGSTGPLFVEVEDGSGCASSPLRIDINTNCIQEPGCPENLSIDYGASSDGGTYCADDGTVLDLCISYDALPAGGTVDWYASTESGAPADIENDQFLGNVEIPALPDGGCPDCTDPSVYGLIVNEFSQGSGGGGEQPEWMELLVISDENINLDGWILNDNDGALGAAGIAPGYLFFNTSNSSACSALENVPPGSLIVIYNDDSPDGTLPDDDPYDSDGDGVYVLPGDHVCFNACETDSYPCSGADIVAPEFAPSFGGIQFRNGGDAIMIYNPDGDLFHAITYGDLGSSAGSPYQSGSGGNRFYEFSCGDYTSSGNYSSSTPSTNATPGAANDSDNEFLIDVLTDPNKCFDCGNLDNNCDADDLPQPTPRFDDPECFQLTIDGTFCADEPYFLKARVSPLSVSCDEGADEVDGEIEIFVNCFTANVVTPNISLCQGETGEIVIEVIGGVPRFDLNYTLGADNNNLNDQNPDENNYIYFPIDNVTADGTIDFVLNSITDDEGRGCLGTILNSTVSVSISPTPEAQIISTDGAITCNSDYDFQVAFTGIGPWQFTYEVDGIIFDDIAPTSPHTISTDVLGTYQLISAVDDNGCVATINPATVEVSSTEIPELIFDLPDFCDDGTVVLDLNNDILPLGQLDNMPIPLTGTLTFYTGNPLDPDFNPSLYDINNIDEDAATTGVQFTPIAGLVLYAQYTDVNTGCNSVTSIVFNLNNAACCGADIGNVRFSTIVSSTEVCVGQDLLDDAGSSAILISLDNIGNPLINSGFDYVYLLVNSGGDIIAISEDGDFDFSTFMVGTYSINVLSYAESNTPSSVLDYLNGKNNISDIDETEGCMDLASINSISINIINPPPSNIDLDMPTTFCAGELPYTLPNPVVDQTDNTTYTGTWVDGDDNVITEFNPSEPFATSYTIRFVHDACFEDEQLTITVSDFVPIVYDLADAEEFICTNADPIDLADYTGITEAGTFHIDGSNTVVTEFDPATIDVGDRVRIDFRPDDPCLQANPFFITITDVVNITFNPLPTDLCPDATAFDLDDYINEEETGAWSANGTELTDGIFDPNSLGEGTYTITFEPDNPCAVVPPDLLTIEVKQLPPVITPPAPFCTDDDTPFDLEFLYFGAEGTWSSTEIILTGSTFVPSSLSAGTYTVEFVDENEDACLPSEVEIVIEERTETTLTPVSFCPPTFDDPQGPDLTPYIPDGVDGQWYGDDVDLDGEHIAITSMTPANNFTVFYGPSGDGCLDVYSLEVTVTSAFEVTASAPNCSLDGTSFEVTFTISGGIGPYTDENGNTVSVGEGTFTRSYDSGDSYNFTISGGGNCNDVVVDSGGAINCECTPPPVPVPTNPSFEACEEEDITLSVTDNGDTYIWFSDDQATNQIGQGSSITANDLTTGTYYVLASSNNCPSELVSVDVNILPKPNLVAVDNEVDYCEGETIPTLEVIDFGGGTFTWYDDIQGTNSIGSGATYTPSVSEEEGIFYVQKDSLTCLSDLIAITLSKNPQPPEPSALPIAPSYCLDDPALVEAVRVTNTSYTLVWEDENGDVVGTGTTFDLVKDTEGTFNYTFYQEDANGCRSEGIGIGYTIAECACPTFSNEPADVNLCSGADVTLELFVNAQNPADVEEIRWLLPDGSVVATGATFTVDEEVSGCSPVTFTYNYELVCANTSEVSDNGTVSVIYYPEPTLDEEYEITTANCVVPSVTLNTDCGGVLTPNADVPTEILEGESGTASWTYTYTAYPDCEYTISTPYACLATECSFATLIRVISDNIAVCDGDQLPQIDLSPIQIDIGDYLGSSYAIADFIWSENDDLSNPIADINAFPLNYVGGNNCAPIPVNLFVGVPCWNDATAAPVAIGTLTVEVYPNYNPDLITVTGLDACDGTMPTISSTCGLYSFEEVDVQASGPGATSTWRIFVDENIAPISCFDAEIPFSSNCPIVEECFTVTTNIAGQSEICEGGSVNFASFESLLAVDDEASFSELVWFEDAAFTMPFDTLDLDTSLPDPSCDANAIQLFGGAICTAGAGDTIPAGAISIIVYPAISYAFIDTTHGVCGQAPNLSVNCDNYVVTADDDNPTEVNPGDSGIAIWQIDWAGNPCHSATTVIEVPYTCGDVCPIVSISQDANQTVCAGIEVYLGVSITPADAEFNTDYTLQWRKDGVDVPGATFNNYSFTSAQTNCDVITETYSVVYTCLNPGAPAEEIAAGTLTIYPVTIDPDDLVVSYQDCEMPVLDLSACNGYSVADSSGFVSDIEPGDSGIVIWNFGNEAGCMNASFEANFNCPEIEEQCSTITSSLAVPFVGTCDGSTEDLSILFDEVLIEPSTASRDFAWYADVDRMQEITDFTFSYNPLNPCDPYGEEALYLGLVCVTGEVIPAGETIMRVYPIPEVSQNDPCSLELTPTCGDVVIEYQQADGVTWDTSIPDADRVAWRAYFPTTPDFDNDGLPNCLASGEVNTNDAEVLEIDAGQAITICEGDPINLIGEFLQGTGTSTWSTFEGLGSFGSISDLLTNYQPLLEDVGSSFYMYLTGDNGCVNVTDSVLVTIFPQVDLNIVPNGATTITAGETIALTVEGADNVIWNDDPSLSCLDCITPIVTPSETTTYQVTSNDPCEATQSITIQVVPDTQLETILIPNAFSPNGDLLNDVFQITADENIESFEMFIYDRWGEKLYETTDITLGWDGTYKEEIMPLGVYVYMIRFKLEGEDERLITGNITLLK